MRGPELEEAKRLLVLKSKMAGGGVDGATNPPTTTATPFLALVAAAALARASIDEDASLVVPSDTPDQTIPVAEAPPLLEPAMEWGAFMGSSGNARQQLIAGVERVMRDANAKMPALNLLATLVLRVGNNVWGGEQFATKMREMEDSVWEEYSSEGGGGVNDQKRRKAVRGLGGFLQPSY